MQQNLEQYNEAITEDNVQHYSRHTKELKITQVQKALQFVRYNSIRYIGNIFHSLDIPDSTKEKYVGIKNVFLCLPLNTKEDFNFFGLLLDKKPFDRDYNSSEYIIFKNKEGNFECNCQGWQSKARKGEIVYDGANCSHILSLFYMFKLGRFRK